MQTEQARTLMASTIERLLTDSPDPAVRSVLYSRFSGREVDNSATESTQNKWHALLASRQMANGNWRRFHRNLKNVPLREAVNKAIVVGLELESPVLAGASSFATTGLRLSLAELPDYLLEAGDPARSWASPAISLAVLVNVASRLAASTGSLKSALGKLTDVVHSAYPQGEYSRDAEHALLDSKGLVVHWDACQEVWQAAREPIIVEVMGMHALALSANFRKIYFQDLWHNFRFYDNYPPVSSGAPDPSPNAAASWFMNQQILSLFPEWQAAAHDHVDYLWEQRDDMGRWDFGAPSDTSGFASRLQISSKWTARARKHDWSLHALALLSRYYGEEMDWPTKVSSRCHEGRG